jgi:hypothetical protein
MESKVFESGLWVIVLEMCSAFGLGAFIIWWTWPRKPKPPARDEKAGEKADEKKNQREGG